MLEGLHGTNCGCNMLLRYSVFCADMNYDVLNPCSIRFLPSFFVFSRCVECLPSGAVVGRVFRLPVDPTYV